MTQTDVLIIGGGPSGSVAASSLRQKGYDVVVLEKEHFPRFVIGESLLPMCNRVLEENNLLETVQKQGYMVKGGAFFITPDKEEIKVDFQKNLGQKHGTTFQVKREEFDTVLLDKARELGADVRHGITVTGYDQDENIVTAQDENGDTVHYQAGFVLDASGYGRVLPRLLHLDAPSDLRHRNAIFTRVSGEFRREGFEEGFIDIVIGDKNKVWLWVIPFSDNTTSFGVVCEDEDFKASGLSQEAFLDRIVANHPYLKEKFAKAEKLNSVQRIDGYSSGIKQLYGKGYALCGNATEFLDPVFSSGVTLALESSNVVAKMIDLQLQGKNPNWQKDYEEYMLKGIEVFRQFVYAWYDGRLQKIFFSKKKQDTVERSIASILSGYVWDEQNYFVKDPKDKIDTLVSLIDASPQA
ncbi:MAG: NAD(P)/FAD-dependent oxidoreductase [Campylobacterota bacterium]